MAKTSDGNRVDQVMGIIKEMTILELRDLNKRIQEDFGISAAAPVAVVAAVGVAATRAALGGLLVAGVTVHLRI